MSDKISMKDTLGADDGAMRSADASITVFTDNETRHIGETSIYYTPGDTVSFWNITGLANYHTEGDFNEFDHLSGVWLGYTSQVPVDEAPEIGEIASAWSFWSFSNRDRTAPTIISFDPSDGSDDVAIGTDITLTFSEEVKACSGLIQIRIGSPNGTVVESFFSASSSRLTFSGNKLIIDPTSDLHPDTHYYVTFTRGSVIDLFGNKYSGMVAYDFITENIDTSGPVVFVFSPADGSGNVAVETNITLTFNEAVQAGSGFIEVHSNSGALFESFDVASSSRLTFSGNTLTIDPTNNFELGTQYSLSISYGAVLDFAGNKYSGTTSYDFTTEFAQAQWDTVSGYGLLDIDAMLELATGNVIADAPLYGDGYNSWDWGLNDVQAPDAWLTGYTGEGIIVAIVDSGVYYSHSDLAGNIWVNFGEISGNGVDDDGNGYIDDIYGYDFVNDDGYALDDNGHGTHIAGIIAGLHNGTGVTGVAYDATIMPVKVVNSSGHGSFEALANGIVYAVDNGADVINLSLGTYGADSSSVTSAISYALDNGVIVCMASGNDYRTSPTYPAILAQSLGGIVVGAVNSSNLVASFSNEADNTDPYDFVVAPGVDIYSTYNNGGYTLMSGTSMATPYVTGAAALLLSAESDYASAWSLEELESILTKSADFLGTSSLVISSSMESVAGGASTYGFELNTMQDDFIGLIDAEPVKMTGLPDGVWMDYDVFVV